MPKIIRFILLFLWLVFITITSLIKVNKFTSVTIPHLDKGVHFFFYFVLTYLLFLVISFTEKENSKWKFAIVLAMHYGIIIEVLQGVLPIERSPQFSDVVANAFGCFAAWFVGTRIPKRLNFKK